MNICFLSPAYGKTYRTLEQLIQGWRDGHDFKIGGGPYCSIRDIEELKKQFDKIEIIYTGCENYRVY